MHSNISNEEGLHPHSNLDRGFNLNSPSFPDFSSQLRTISRPRPTHLMKVLLIGVGRSGKRELFIPFVDSHFFEDYSRTIGVDVYIKEVDHDEGESSVLSIWNISSAERFDFVRNTFYKGASAVIGIFDLTDYSTWSDLLDWLDEVKSACGEIPIFIIGNRKEQVSDNESVINSEECQDFAEFHNGFYLETESDGTQMGPNLFKRIAKSILTIYNKYEFDPSRIIRKLRKGKGISKYETSHPLLGPNINFILEKIKDVDNPIANEFRKWVSKEFSIDVGSFKLLL